MGFRINGSNGLQMPELGSSAKNLGNTTKKLSNNLTLDSSDFNVQNTIIETPWAELKDTFFSPISIDGDKWNKLYPYRLLVVDAAKNYEIVSGFGSVSAKTESISGGGYRIAFQEFGNKWELQLPITPQQLQISTQYAIATSATQKGVVEEHSGVRFKNIICSGTMGVWPHRPNTGVKLESPSITQTLFGGTLNAVTNLDNQVNSLVRSVTQNHPAPKPQPVEPAKAPGGYNGTGYVYAMLWEQFLEQYAEMKRFPQFSSYRLVFDIPKQNQSFIVTPIQFTWNQSADSPNEIKYSFQLKAWKRISLQGTTVEPAPFDDLVTLSPNVLQRALTAIENARRVVGAALNVVKAVRSDFQTPFNALRQVTLLIKDFSGLPQALIDLPRDIVADFRSTIKAIDQDFSSDAISASAKSSAAAKLITGQKKQNEGLSDNQVSSGQIGSSAAFGTKTDPTNEIFESPEEYFDLFNSLNVSDLPLTPEQQLRIDSAQTDPESITVDDLIQYRNQILDLATQISNFFGAGDAYFSEIYGKQAPYSRAQEMSIDEYQILQSLYEAVQNIDNLTATQEIDDGRIASAMEYVGGVANSNDITFETSQSKIKVPVPYGLSIEEIALRYLGDADRWVEITTLNALKSPYIDENGFTIPLLSNAAGRQFNIATAENLYLGQKVTLQSNTQIPTTRRIINIEKINETNYLISLDGLDNLDAYTTLDSARLKAYLPGTTNSQSDIFVPSDADPSNFVNTKSVPSLSQDSLVGLSRIDWLLQEDGDVALDIYGDIKLSAGLTNLVQALKLKFLVPTGKLLKHPDFGAGIKAGGSSANLNATEIYNQIKSAVLSDTRFSSIEKLEVILDGPKLTINMSVGYNKNQVLPLSFSVNL